MKKEKGFTLVEVAVASTVLALALVGTIGIFIYGIRNNKDVQNKAIARYAARDVMEQLKVMPINDLSAQDGVVFAFTGIPGLINQNIGQITVTDGGSNDKIYQIIISIINPQNNGARPFTVSFTTRRAR